MHRQKRTMVWINALGGAAVLGSEAFCFQTAVLEALVWPAFFPI